MSRKNVFCSILLVLVSWASLVVQHRRGISPRLKALSPLSPLAETRSLASTSMARSGRSCRHREIL